MNTLRERLIEARTEAKLSQAALAKLVKCGQTTIASIENGRNQSSSILARVAAALGVNALWLAEGKGPKRSTANVDVTSYDQLTGETTLIEVKAMEPGADYVSIGRVLFKLSAGCTGYQVEPIEGNGPPIFFRRDWVERNNYNPAKLLAVRINGSSMEPGLYDSDLVVINTADVKPHDGDVFAANFEGELVIKRLKRDAGEWWLTSDNQDKRRFPDKRCDEHASLIGKVIYKQSERI